MTHKNAPYVGTELELFSRAVNWKRYFASTIEPYIKGNVLEVGCGLGENIKYLINKEVRNWTAIEPDADLYNQACQKQMTGDIPAWVCFENSDISQLQDHTRYFDCLAYIDVLEHIADDVGELDKASALVKPNGYIVVLAPAYQWLYSDFDAAIGHFKRYDRKSLRGLTNSSLDVRRLFYLDSVGIVLSLLNRHFLKQDAPSPEQIRKWDTFIVPLSRLLDRLVFHSLGKSVVCVWQKRASV